VPAQSVVTFVWSPDQGIAVIRRALWWLKGRQRPDDADGVN